MVAAATAAGFLAAAARRWIVTLLLDTLVLGASILKPDFHLIIPKKKKIKEFSS